MQGGGSPTCYFGQPTVTTCQSTWCGIEEGVEDVVKGVTTFFTNVFKCQWSLVGVLNDNSACEKLLKSAFTMTKEGVECFLDAETHITSCPIGQQLVSAYETCEKMQNAASCIAKYTTVAALTVITAVVTDGAGAGGAATGIEDTADTAESGILDASKTGCAEGRRRLRACKDSACRAAARRQLGVSMCIIPGADDSSLSDLSDSNHDFDDSVVSTEDKLGFELDEIYDAQLKKLMANNNAEEYYAGDEFELSMMRAMTNFGEDAPLPAGLQSKSMGDLLNLLDQQFGDGMTGIESPEYSGDQTSFRSSLDEMTGPQNSLKLSEAPGYPGQGAIQIGNEWVGFVPSLKNLGIALLQKIKDWIHVASG